MTPAAQSSRPVIVELTLGESLALRLASVYGGAITGVKLPELEGARVKLRAAEAKV